MSIQVNYILLASGHVVTPRLEIAIFEEELPRVSEEAAKRVSALAKGREYFRFDLYDVRTEEHVLIKSFSVEIPEPVITVR